MWNILPLSSFIFQTFIQSTQCFEPIPGVKHGEYSHEKDVCALMKSFRSLTLLPFFKTTVNQISSLFISKGIKKTEDQCSLNYISIHSFSNRPTPLQTPHTSMVNCGGSFPEAHKRARTIFYSKRKRVCGYCPWSLELVSPFLTFYSSGGNCGEPSGSLTPPSHPRHMQWLLLCHYEEFFFSQNHSSFASDFQYLPFWHFWRNKIQVWCWKDSIDFFSERISSPYYCFP